MCGSKRWMKAVAGLLFAVIVFSSLPAVALTLPGMWKTYTSKKEIRDVAIKNGIVWAATRGGMFSMNLVGNEFQEFTTSEGLRTNDLSAITVDRSGTVWTGAINGMIHAYKPSSSQWNYITDIARYPDPQKQINTLLAVGDTLYMGSEIGLSLYSITRDEFGITARSFGSGLQITGNVRGIALFQDSIWVGTANGMAAAPRSHPNLNSPTSWRVLQTVLPSNAVSSLTVFGNVLFVATDRGLVRYDGSSWMTVTGTEGKNIARVVSDQNFIYCVAPNELLKINGGVVVTNIPSPTPDTSLAVEGMNIVVGSMGNGVYIQKDNIWEAHIPKGPPTNLFSDLAVDERGVLWLTTGGHAGGEGFVSFDGKVWISYRRQQYPILGTDAYYKVDIGKDNVKWLSSWGNGVARVDADGEIRKVFTRSDSLPPTIPPSYIVVAGVVTDGEGKAWICIRTGNVVGALAAVSGDSIFSTVFRPNLGGSPWFGDIAIDRNDTKWIVDARTSPSPSPGGVYFYNERGFGDNGTDQWRRISEEDGLVSNLTLSLAVDHSGQIWVGTDKGINIIVNPYFISTSGRLRPQLAFYVPLSGQRINALAVDPLDNKWVATNQGVFVLSSDGTSILAHYSVESTDGKLVADEIQSMAIDSRTGTVYIGSDRGLSALSTAAVVPARSFDGLTITPNPFYVPSSSSITIDGLVQNSSLKILSIDGHVVTQLKTPGGGVGYWDGKDSEGNFVSSGIYIVVAFSENGNQVAAGKVAVLRR